MTSWNLKGKTSEQLRRMAKEAIKESYDSFERCDTDGFLSQASNQIASRVYNAQADIVENNGLSSFPALFDLNGNRVRAKLIDAKFGATWAFCDMNDKFTGKFISAFPQKTATMAKKGFKEDYELAPAIADNGGSMGMQLIVNRTDKGYPENAIEVK